MEGESSKRKRSGSKEEEKDVSTPTALPEFICLVMFVSENPDDWPDIWFVSKKLAYENEDTVKFFKNACIGHAPKGDPWDVLDKWEKHPDTKILRDSGQVQDCTKFHIVETFFVVMDH